MNVLVINSRNKLIAEQRDQRPAKVLLVLDHLKNSESFGFANSIDALNFIQHIKQMERDGVKWRENIEWAVETFRVSELWTDSRRRKNKTLRGL